MLPALVLWSVIYNKKDINTCMLDLKSKFSAWFILSATMHIKYFSSLISTHGRLNLLYWEKIDGN